LVNLTDSIVAVIIEDGAHHLDLRSSDPADPSSVRLGRFLEIQQIIGWIDQAKKK
jgi:lysosomal Pro-X carboxypeptidase